MVKPEDIKLSKILPLLEGSIAPVDCVISPTMCPRSGTCASRDIWEEVGRAITDVLESWTLQDLVETQDEKDRCNTEMYHI